MDEIWRKWTEHYISLGLDPKTLCKDGIIDSYTLKPKILFILKEVNQFPGGDLRALFKERPYGIGKTLARWTAGILKGFPVYSDIKNLDENALKDYLSKVAVINLKKISGREQSDDSIINAYAHQDRELLLEQIDSINADIIVACSTMNALIWLLDLKVDSNNPFRKPVRYKSTGKLVIPFRHSSRDNNPQESYKRLKELVKPK